MPVQCGCKVLLEMCSLYVIPTVEKLGKLQTDSESNGERNNRMSSDGKNSLSSRLAVF